MSKVIRIDDDTFARLQNLAEPFIDTPSTVVERLLNYYESRQASILEPKIGKNIVSSNQKENKMAQNLFLAPASEENLRKTIKRSIGLASIENLLSDKEQQVIKSSVSNPSFLNCWAMTESNRTKYNEMSPGDVVIFSVKDSGKFQYCGKVVAKIENEKLGKQLWDFVPTKAWKLIYFLEEIKSINISKSKLVVALGYDKNYVVPGVIKINPVARDTVLTQHRNFDAFINSFSA